MSISAAGSSRFEQSFMFHMIRDFFLLLMVVAAVEMTIRYLVLRWDFSRQEPARVDQAAQRLANDIRSIMLNSGGPTAAQTIYPILKRNHDDLGLAIAVLPSAVTVESMRASRNMEVQGLQPSWTDGEHRQAGVELQAEQFCLNCHIKAKVGDVLGTVQVRSYLQRKEAQWWQEVRVTAGALSLKILVHTVLLFLLLRVRMEPLLSLRATVSGLARGVMDLSPRAGVKSQDEFGELAQDLNHFLDRIAGIVKDLDRILSEVVAVGTRLGALNRHLERQLDGLRDTSLRALGESSQLGRATQLVAARESGAFKALVQTMDELVAGADPPPNVAVLRSHLLRLRSSFDALGAALQDTDSPVVLAESQSAEYQAFAQSLRDMALLEAKMQQVAESGQQVLQRLQRGRADAS